MEEFDLLGIDFYLVRAAFQHTRCISVDMNTKREGLSSHTYKKSMNG